MAKSEPRTMRFTSEAEEYINTFDGNNFTEKFHNAVHFFKFKEQEQKATLERFEKEIQDKRKRLKDLSDILFDTRHLENHFTQLIRSLGYCHGYLENFIPKDVISN